MVCLQSLPIDAFQCILNTLLLHPAIWNRKTHVHEGGGDHDHGCECCQSRHPHCSNLATAIEKEEGCAICVQAWVLTTLCKNMMQSVQMHNATCSCLTCAKSWMDRGWHCPDNPFYMYTMPWMQRSLRRYLAEGGTLVDPLDLDWLDEDEEDEEEDQEEDEEEEQEGEPVAARVRATYLLPACMHALGALGEGSG